jgi:hypothetical protein
MGSLDAGGYAARLGRGYLRVDVDATAKAGLGVNGVYIQREITLRLPDNSAVKPDNGVPLDLHLMDNKQGKATLSFPIAAPIAGKYELVWGDSKLPFTVDLPESDVVTPSTLVPQTPPCPSTVADLTGEIVPKDKPFSVGVNPARRCAVVKDTKAQTVAVVIAMTNEMLYPYTIARANFILGDGTNHHSFLKATENRIATGTTGVLVVTFSTPNGLKYSELRSSAGGGETLLVNVDNVEPARMNSAVDVKGEITCADGNLRFTGAALRIGTEDDTARPQPGRVFLAIKFDYLAPGTVAVKFDDVIADIFTLYQPMKGLALKLPSGATSQPANIQPMAPSLYAREQDRGIPTAEQI